jgi:hypothetical protein
MKLLMKLFSKKTALQVKLSCAKRALKENWLHLFLSKGRRAAVSFKKEVIEHHEPKLTTPPQKQHTQTNSANKTLHHLNVGEKPKEAAANRAVITNIVSRQKPRPAASQSGNLNSSTTSPSSSGRTPLAVDPMLRPSVGKKLLSCHQCNCWRKMCTQRQSHSKPKSLASHAQRESDVPVNFSWKLTKDKTVKYQNLELTGWYQAVPYLRLRSQARRHVAMRSYLSKNHNHSGNREGKKNIAEWVT